MKSHRTCTALAAATVLLSLSLIAPTPAPAQTTYEPYAFTTLAGLAGYDGSTNGTGSAARFSGPHGVAVDSSGTPDGHVSLWTLDASGGFTSAQTFGPFNGWSCQSLTINQFNNQQHLLWQNTNGSASIWRLGSTGAFETSASYGPY
jgi:hypothetical protein